MKGFFIGIAILITVNTAYSMQSKSGLSLNQAIKEGADLITGLLQGGRKTLQTLDNTGEQITSEATRGKQQAMTLRKNTEERIQAFDRHKTKNAADVGNRTQQFSNTEQNMNATKNMVKNTQNFQNTNKIPNTRSINFNQYSQRPNQNANRGRQPNNSSNHMAKFQSSFNNVGQRQTKEIPISRNQPRRIIINRQEPRL